MSEQKISVIVPCYNVEEYITECVSSLISQTYDNIEIILINDGSTDSTLSILESFAEKDNRIQIINQVNKGLSMARNAGLSASSGDYLLFVDSDDYLAPNCISILLEHILSDSADIAIISYLKLNDDTKEISSNCFLSNKLEYLSPHDYVLNLLKSKLPWMSGIAVWGKLYKKEIFNDISFTEGIYCEDADILLRILQRSNKTVFYPESGYVYRVRKTSISHTVSPKYVHDNLLWINNYIEYFSSIDDKEILSYLHLKRGHDILLHFSDADTNDQDLLKKYYKESRHSIIFSKFITIRSKLKYLYHISLH